MQRHHLHQQHPSVRREGGLQRRRGRAVLQLHLLRHADHRHGGGCEFIDFVDTKPELHRKFAIKFLTVLKARMRIIARFVCIAMASFLYLLLKVKAEEMIVNYDGQESGDYEEEDNGGTFGSWDLW